MVAALAARQRTARGLELGLHMTLVKGDVERDAAGTGAMRSSSNTERRPRAVVLGSLGKDVSETGYCGYRQKALPESRVPGGARKRTRRVERAAVS